MSNCVDDRIPNDLSRNFSLVASDDWEGIEGIDFEYRRGWQLIHHHCLIAYRSTTVSILSSKC